MIPPIFPLIRLELRRGEERERVRERALYVYLNELGMNISFLVARNIVKAEWRISRDRGKLPPLQRLKNWRNRNKVSRNLQIGFGKV